MAKGKTNAAGSLDLGGLQARVERRGHGTWIALAGRINEFTNFTPLTQQPGPLTLDLGDIDRINSLGVRSWMYFVRDLEKAGVDLTFERCAPVMVSQSSMITNFLGSRSRVVSIVVPYLCVQCNLEHLQLLTLTPGASVTTAVACPKCGSRMVLDEVVETYSGLLGSN
jgi:DNA-directed RNA polymerase subunit RPC12/RpoP/anti-anti-sigma regulatory factor